MMDINVGLHQSFKNFLKKELKIGNVSENQGTANELLKLINRRFKKLKGTLSGLRQFLRNGSPLKMMKNAFYFTLKALFVLKIFTFLS